MQGQGPVQVVPGWVGAQQQELPKQQPMQTPYVFLQESWVPLKGYFFSTEPQEAQLFGVPDKRGRFVRFDGGRYTRGLHQPILALANRGWRLHTYGSNKGYRFAVMSRAGAAATPGARMGVGSMSEAGGAAAQSGAAQGLRGAGVTDMPVSPVPGQMGMEAPRSRAGSRVLEL